MRSRGSRCATLLPYQVVKHFNLTGVSLRQTRSCNRLWTNLLPPHDLRCRTEATEATVNNKKAPLLSSIITSGSYQTLTSTSSKKGRPSIGLVTDSTYTDGLQEKDRRDIVRRRFQYKIIPQCSLSVQCGLSHKTISQDQSN